MNIVNIAKQYFTLEDKGNEIYQIVNPTGEFDSVVIWGKTNSYRRFSISKSGGVREFLKYIVGLSDSEIENEYGIIASDNLTSTLRSYKRSKQDTGYALQDILYTPGYNAYIESRMLTEETARFYNLEVNGEDAAIPLYEHRDRIGTLYRNSASQVKGDRYRTMLVGTHEKPCVWPFPHLYNLRKNNVVVLVEGAWSVMRIHQVIKPLLPNIVPLATLGTNLTDELRDYLYEFKIIAILDDDTGGNQVASTLKEWMKLGLKIESYLPSFTQVNHYDQSSYVDDLSDKQLIKIFRAIKKQSHFLD